MLKESWLHFRVFQDVADILLKVVVLKSMVLPVRCLTQIVYIKHTSNFEEFQSYLSNDKWSFSIDGLNLDQFEIDAWIHSLVEQTKNKYYNEERKESESVHVE